MPRQPPHFKVRTSVKNHPKMAAVWADPKLLALWVKLGVEAIERYADRTGDSFIVHDRELPALASSGRADVARTLLSRLAHVSPMSAERDGDIWRITLPNFSKKQGFAPRKGAETVPPSSSSSTTTTTSSKSVSEPPVQTPTPRPPARAKKPEPPDALAFAHAFATALRRVHDKPRIPSDLTPWARAARLMVERDGRTYDDLREVCRWLFDEATGDEDATFWRTNVVWSVPKLREVFPRLVAARDRPAPRTVSQRAADELDAWAEAKRSPTIPGILPPPKQRRLQ